MSAQSETGHAPSITTNALDKNLDRDHGGEKDLEYATPLRLVIIMCTLSLSTLIAALDLVIPSQAHDRQH